jgi:diguanylate cyclase (GGDEF)-like protein
MRTHDQLGPHSAGRTLTPDEDAVYRLPSVAIVRDTVRRSKRAVLMALVFAVVITCAIVAERSILLHRSEYMGQRIAAAYRVSGAVLLADERLTTAAKMASMTGDPSWKLLYDRYITDIDHAIDEAIRLSPPDVAADFKRDTKVANDQLVSLEQEVFASIERKDLGTAQEIMVSEQYNQYKRILNDGTRAFTASIIEAAKRDLRDIQALADSILVALISIICASSIWLWRRLSLGLEASHGFFVKAQRAASSDALTGVANRVSMRDALSLEIATARRNNTEVAVLMIDLDHFKPVNDRYGHPVGDEVLRAIAGRIVATLRPGSLTCRYGGDEFAVVIPYAPDGDSTEQIAHRIIKAISAPLQVGRRSINVGACVGASMFPRDAETEDDLILHADIALSLAKKTGKGKCVLYRPDMLDSESIHRQRVAELRQAIASNQIVPYVHPVVSLADGHVIGLEILSRWEHPTRGLLPPSECITLAEQSGEISNLTLSVLRQACLQAIAVPLQIRLAINAAAPQIEDFKLAEDLQSILIETNFPPDRLEVELTENALVRDIDAARRTIAALRTSGLSVALDDFGTGYSSLAYLSELSFDRIKIDRSFVRSMHERPDSAKVVSAIVSLAKNLGARITAEGVETTSDADALATLGCDAAQGFLYAQPMPITEFDSWHRRHLEQARAHRRLRLVSGPATPS